MVSMDCMAVGRLVWVTLLVGDVVCWTVHEVFAVWQLWGAMWATALLFWVGGVKSGGGGGCICM